MTDLLQRVLRPIGLAAAGLVIALAIASHARSQTYGTVSITIEYPLGPAASYDVPISPGLTVEGAMKLASVMTPNFKWTSVWYGGFGSYLVIAFNDVKNDDYVDANSRFWQFCAGQKGTPQTPATRGVSLFGLAPNDKVTWQLVKDGGLKCPNS
jgi:hypothetical protein